MRTAYAKLESSDETWNFTGGRSERFREAAISLLAKLRMIPEKHFLFPASDLDVAADGMASLEKPFRFFGQTF